MPHPNVQLAPLPRNAECVELQCLDGGSLVAAASKVHASAGDETFRMYNWAFYIKDTHSGRRVLWDLGLSGKSDDYTPWVQKFMIPETAAVGPRKSITEQLAKRGVTADQIEAILFSHAHWDHCRPIDTEFPRACAFFGPGTAEHCSPGHLVSEEAKEMVQWDGRYFDPKRATQNWKSFDGPWVKFGAFEKAMDFFGNGSFWVIQAQGHMPGNLCAAAHVAKDEWILLGSDCCHTRRLYDGLEEFAVWKLPSGCSVSLHADIEAAKDTIVRIRLMEEEMGCHIAFAHDTEWMKSGKNATLMSMLDEELRVAAKYRLPLQAVV